jgi:hypothetical protein
VQRVSSKIQLIRLRFCFQLSVIGEANGKIQSDGEKNLSKLKPVRSFSKGFYGLNREKVWETKQKLNLNREIKNIFGDLARIDSEAVTLFLLFIASLLFFQLSGQSTCSVICHFFLFTRSCLSVFSFLICNFTLFLGSFASVILHDWL